MLPRVQNHSWLITNAFVPGKCQLLINAHPYSLQLVLFVVQMKQLSPQLKKVNTIMGLRYTNAICRKKVLIKYHVLSQYLHVHINLYNLHNYLRKSILVFLPRSLP